MQVQDFLRAVMEGRAPLITTEAGRAVTELIAAIYQSNESRSAIRL